MQKTFIYGVSVEGENFTDRELETKRLKLNFESGVNSILLSPRRMGKTSLVKHVMNQMKGSKTKVIFMDIYKCRTEYDFYELFASSIIQQTSTKVDKMIESAKEFLISIAPKITYNPAPDTSFSLSLGLNPKTNRPEEILSLPEQLAIKRGIRIVVCIDEFQQIGEMPDSLAIQKTIRSVWQHHKNTSYCLFGSKQHLLTNLFYRRNMPFYHFGDIFFLKKITTEKWLPFIIKRFNDGGKSISEKIALQICNTVENYPAYVQQLSWNVFACSNKRVTEEAFLDGLEATLAQVTPLFIEQTSNLTTYQLNFLRSICVGHNKEFGKKSVSSEFNLGSRSNLAKLKSALIEREIVEMTEDGTIQISDPLFKYWFKKEMM